MQLVERHIIKRGASFWSEIDRLCFGSKNLYNKANYNVRQGVFSSHIYSNYNLLDKVLKGTPEYQALPAKVSQQILLNLEQNWKSYFAAVKEWSENPDKFPSRPKPPNYKEKNGRHLLIYTTQAISKKSLAKGVIKLSGTSLEVPTSVNPSLIRQVRIVPKTDCYVIEVIYEAIELEPVPSRGAMAALDLGLNNLGTLTSNQPGFVPILVNGRPLKSLNQFYNKKKASLECQLRGRRFSRRLAKLTRKRNQRVDNYLHQTTSYLVEQLVSKGIDTLVIGKNPNWKQKLNLGRANNQNFVNVPHNKLISQLTYKCQLVGIRVIEREESYTSVASFLDLDEMPVYGEEGASTVRFSGKRIKRGLYRAGDGRLINADVNGSYNILRKAFPEAFCDGIGSCVVQPRRVTPTKVRRKGETGMSLKAA